MSNVCCICGKMFIGWGNNPAGAARELEDGTVELMDFSAEARCCDVCNIMHVIPGRIYRAHMQEKEDK